jgi:hypothetical protein
MKSKKIEGSFLSLSSKGVTMTEEQGRELLRIIKSNTRATWVGAWTSIIALVISVLAIVIATK